jgi:hypothetical protein
MTINELFQESHETAKVKGWWGNPRNPLEILMLINCELAEAAEEFRKGKPDKYYSFDQEGNLKPEGYLAELADALIRMGDFIEHSGCTAKFELILKEKMEYNRTREYRHGGKKY